jgi:excisionase family DNA binding protein
MRKCPAFAGLFRQTEAAPTGAAFSFSGTSSRFFPTLFHINPQKSLILDEQGSIIILYYCIYLKVRAKMDSNIERWYSMKEICEYLGVSRDTVLAWIDKREMPATKIGRLWKFKISEVDAWMKSGVAAEK